jgi:hypothetical protein
MEITELNEIIKRFNNIREERLTMQRRTDKLKEQENDLKGQVIVALKESGLNKAANVKLQLKPKPVAKDWNAIHEYIIEHDAWDIMQRRLGEVAIRDRWENDEAIPGVDKFPVDDLSVGKRVD